MACQDMTRFSRTRTTTSHLVEDHARFESKADAPGVQELRGAITEDGVLNSALKRSHHRRWSALCST